MLFTPLASKQVTERDLGQTWLTHIDIYLELQCLFLSRDFNRGALYKGPLWIHKAKTQISASHFSAVWPRAGGFQKKQQRVPASLSCCAEDTVSICKVVEQCLALFSLLLISWRTRPQWLKLFIQINKKEALKFHKPSLSSLELGALCEIRLV